MAGDSMLASQVGLTPQRLTILLVEDDVLVRLAVADELRKQGLHVLEASNAAEALLVLDSALAIDLVFTDIRMPGAMDGLGLAKLVRAGYPDLKLVITSGERLTEAASAADAFVPKPYNASAVVALVERLLETGSP